MFSYLYAVTISSYLIENGTIEEYKLEREDICLRNTISCKVQVKSVCKGMDHSIILSNEGLVYSFGNGRLVRTSKKIFNRFVFTVNMLCELLVAIVLELK